MPETPACRRRHTRHTRHTRRTRYTRHTCYIRSQATGHLSAAQLCKAIEKLAALIQGCPDPEAWAQQLMSAAEFQPVGPKLLAVVPQLDAFQLREVICAMATLKLHDPRLVTPSPRPSPSPSPSWTPPPPPSTNTDTQHQHRHRHRYRYRYRYRTQIPTPKPGPSRR